MMRSLRANKPKDVVANMIQHFESSYPDGIEVPDIGKVEVNRASAKSIFAHAQPHGMTLPKWAVLAKLEQVLKGSVPFAENTKWKGRKYDSVSSAASMKMGDQDKVVELTITKSPSGKLELYNIKVCLKENVQRPEDSTRHRPESPPGTNSSLNTPHSLPNSALPVNRCGKENSGLPKLPSSNLVRQYLATHGLLAAYLPQTPAQDAFQFDEKAFKTYLSLQGYSR